MLVLRDNITKTALLFVEALTNMEIPISYLLWLMALVG